MFAPQSIAPRDMDALLGVDEFLAWVGKEPTPTNRRWAMRNARENRIPSVKMGDERFFHPRTVLTKCGKAA